MNKLIFLLFFFVQVTVHAETYRRLVNFEWDPIEGSTGYEIEIVPGAGNNNENAKAFSFKVKDSTWNGKLAPGNYVMKLRSLDYRGIPGDWSEATDLNVMLENVRIKSPAANSQVQPKGAYVVAEWKPTPAAKGYEVIVENAEGKVVEKEKVEGTSIKLELKPAEAYNLKVVALGKNGLRSESTSVVSFTSIGGKLPTPVVEKPENQFVRELKWNKSENADNYEVTLARFNSKTKKWEKVTQLLDIKEDKIEFDDKWPGGEYKALVRAKANLYLPSELGKATFKVRNGDRSPAAEMVHEVRKSIDRVNGWYGIASYLLTMSDYRYAPENNQGASYSNITGTGRLGLGWFSTDKPHGFLAIMDYSGFISDEGKVQNYASMEANYVYRYKTGDQSELRLFTGVFNKEMIEVSGQAVNSTETFSYQKLSAMGPHFAAEYWFSLSPKLGMQLNYHYYLNMIAGQTAGGSMKQSASDQMGFLGSYRLSPRLTGLAGIAIRTDRMKYTKDINGVQTDASIIVNGTYLNLFAEYAF